VNPLARSLFAVTLVSTLAACGDDGADATAASSSGGGAGTSSCTDLASCAFPSKDLEVSLVEGVVVDDDLTGRSLPVLIRVPEGPGPHPVVIWSHGGGFNDQGQLFSEAWGTSFARHGYVVVHVAHVTLDAESGAALCALASLEPAQCASGGGGDEDATGLLALVKSRDVIAVLDALPSLSQASVAQGGPALDLERTAVAGWSAGARAPMVLMGATFEPLPGEPPMGMADDRVAAAVALSPAGPGFGGFFEEGAAHSWSSARGPIFFGTGDNDVKPTKQDLNGPVRRQAFELQPADGRRHLLYSRLPAGVGGHPTYDLEDAASTDERVVALSAALDSAARAFLDAYLRDDAEAAAWLASDHARIMAGDADWETR
jgi:dienelactone hydrolase